MCTFSIVIPVYNAKQFLPRCLDSIVKQTYRNFEMVCIDDGSTDGSSAILDGYAEIDKRIRVFHIPNGGIANARNIGLQNAKGDYLCFVDADDWIADSLLETCYNYIKRFCADIYMMDFFKCSKDGKHIYQCGMKNNEGYLPEKSGREMTAETTENKVDAMAGYMKNHMVWNKLFSRRFVAEKGIMFHSLYHADDELFCLETYTLARKVYYINFAGYYYFQNEKSITHQYNDRLLQELRRLYFYKKELKEHYVEDAYLKYTSSSLLTGTIWILTDFPDALSGKRYRDKRKSFYKLMSEAPYADAVLSYEKKYLGNIAKITFLTGKPSYVRMLLTARLKWLKDFFICFR